MSKGSVNIAKFGGSKLTYGPSNRVFPESPFLFKENPAYQNISIVAGITKHDGSFMLTSNYNNV